ncbi:MAG: thioredoxin family protein [Gammaproteobacteria bacterium]|jgi:glutaredoxin|nr:thioredoxin family protein [Gammaproteobacteria bacterium]
MTSTTAPDALLLIGPGCPHCGALLEVLSKLVKSGEIAQLNVINVAQRPEQARELGVRSVPWLRLGEFELEGGHTEGQIKQWLQRVQSLDGKSEYFKELLLGGKLDKAIAMARTHPDNMRSMLLLAKDSELSVKVQLGISAVFEELQGSEILQQIVSDMGVLAENPSAKVRADAAHFLSLTESEQALPYLQQLAKDENVDVREIAEEALSELIRH